ncbi:MAG: DinB family protein, partial [Ignavibacteria bacterium]
HLDENRQAMNTFLYNLTPEQLNRKGTHQKFGTMNVIQWIEFFLLHEAHHIYTIFKITRQFNT